MIKDILSFCKMYNKSTHVPIACFDKTSNDCVLFPQTIINPEIIKTIPSGFATLQGTADYFITDSFSHFGFIDADKMILIIGPVFSTPVTGATVHDVMEEWSISSEYLEEIAQFLQSLPQMSFQRFLDTIAYIYFCINDEILDATEYFGLNSTEHRNEISSAHSDQLTDTKENERYHNTYYFERELTGYIQAGDLYKVKELLSSANNLQEGIIADNTVRQAKNIFIATATLCTRSAIQGGLDIEQAYQLSDVYINSCERSTSLEYISQLTYNIILDFTERVNDNKKPETMTGEIFECIQFITRNVNKPIQINDVADHLNRSRSYIVRKFKKELGFDMSGFIMRCKLEEAKSLLTHTDKSLTEISAYLCFSSQSYFQNVFKKNTASPLCSTGNRHRRYN